MKEERRYESDENKNSRRGETLKKYRRVKKMKVLVRKEQKVKGYG